MKQMMTSVMFAVAAWSVQSSTVTYTGPNGANPGTMFMSDTATVNGAYLWSDNQGVHDGVDYYIGSSPCPGAGAYATSGWKTNYEFPGNSLTIGGGAAPWWNLFGSDYAIDSLTVETGSRLTFDTRRNVTVDYAGTSYAYFNRWHLRGSSWKIDGALEIDVIGRGVGVDVSAVLSGSGTFSFGGWQQNGLTSGSLNFDCALSGDNSAFAGKIAFAHPYATDRANTCALKVWSCANLGGACASFAFDGLRISGFAGLHAAESFVLDTANRGVYFDGAGNGTGYVEVDDGKSLTLATPVRIASGGLRKLGSGTLALASAVSYGIDGVAMADGVNSLVSVEAGFIKPIVSCSNIDFVFASGAGLICDVTAADATVAEYGLVARSLTVEGDSLPVCIDSSFATLTPGMTYSVPVCTVPVSAADALEKKMVSATAGGTCVRETVGDSVRFSISYVAPAKTVVVPRYGDGFSPPMLSAVDVGTLKLTLKNGGSALDAPVAEASRCLVARLSADVREMTEGDVILDGFVADNAGFARVEISGSPGAEREVYVIVSPVVEYVGPSTGYQTFSDATYQDSPLWSDGLAPHGGGHYVFGKATQFRPAGNDKNLGLYVFPGASLTLRKNIGQAYWDNYGSTFVISNLTIAAGAQVRTVDRCTWASTDSNEQTFKGESWRVDGELQFIAAYYRETFRVLAPLSGAGDVLFTSWKGINTYTGFFDSTIDADNSAFKGRIMFGRGEATSADESMGLKVSRAEALGGAPDAFLWDALSFGQFEGLHATETFALATPNRGISFNRSYFEVDTGKTLTVMEPIRILGGGFYKLGTGTLALGSDFTFGADGTVAANGENNVFSVKAGGIKPVSIAGLQKLDVTIENGASLVLDAFPGDRSVREKGLYMPRAGSLAVAGSRLPVKIQFPPGFKLDSTLKVAVCTLSSTDAKSVADKMLVSFPGMKGIKARLAIVDAEEGLKRIEADVCAAGLRMIVR